MEVALYFGSFNPPHCGHAAIAEYLHGDAGFSEVWIVLSPQNPLKDPEMLLDEGERLGMLQAWVSEKPYLHLCTVELEMERPSYTYLTLRRLRKECPQFRFSVVMGADSLVRFTAWREYAEIAANHPILVYPRDGFDAATAAAGLRREIPQAEIRCLEAPLSNVSSTEVRKAVLMGEDISGMVPSAVGRYIRQHALYCQ